MPLCNNDFFKTLLADNYQVRTRHGVFRILTDEEKNATNATEPQLEAGDLAEVTCASSWVGDPPRLLTKLPLSDQLDDEPTDERVTLFCMYDGK